MLNDLQSGVHFSDPQVYRWFHEVTQMLNRLVQPKSDDLIQISGQQGQSTFRLNVDRLRMRLGHHLGGGGPVTGGSYPECSVYCWTADLLAGMVAKILSYNYHTDVYTVGVPDMANLSQSCLIYIAEDVPMGTVGVNAGLIDFDGGIDAVVDGSNLAQGDDFGTEGDSFYLKKGGFGLKLAAPISGTISYVVVTAPGSTYLDGQPGFTLSGGKETGAGYDPRQGRLKAILVDGSLMGVLVEDSGDKYTKAPDCALSPSDKGGSILILMVGQVDGLTLALPGSGYAPSTTYTLTFSGDCVTQATGTVDSDASGVLKPPVLLTRGWGYLRPPTVSVPIPTDHDPKVTGVVKASIA